MTNEQTFWEGLTESLAGFLALHHLDDIVIMERQSTDRQETGRKDAVIDRLGGSYKFYQFPSEASETPGCEVAISAAPIAAGFCGSGLAAEVMQQLLAPTTLL